MAVMRDEEQCAHSIGAQIIDAKGIEKEREIEKERGEGKEELCMEATAPISPQSVSSVSGPIPVKHWGITPDSSFLACRIRTSNDIVYLNGFYY